MADPDPLAAPASPTSTETHTDADRAEVFLQLARQRFRRSRDGEQGLRDRMLTDATFAADLSGKEQWDPRAVVDRTAPGFERPMITVDRLSQPIYMIVNAHRESGAGIQVSPMDQGADAETAEVYQGLIRNIEQQSRAKLAYTWAVEGAVRMGRHWIRIVPEFVSDRSFEQDLRIRRVLDAFSVYPDPSPNEPDYSDANFYFIGEDLLPDEYVDLYGKDSQIRGAEDFRGMGDQVPLWFPNGHIRVLEYYYVEHTKKELVLLRDQAGQAYPVFSDEVEKLQAFLASQQRVIASLTPEQRRDVDVRQIKWVKMNGVEVLKRRDVPGKWIPIVPVIGEELFVNGERDYRGIIRGAKQAAQVYNVQVTALIEAVGLLPKAPFVIAAGQLKGFEDMWKNANVTNFAALVYQQLDVNGTLVPPPQRNPAMPPLAPLVAAIMQADNDIKAATRHFDASLGQRGPQESSKAITARQRQSDYGTAHFQSNFRDISLAHIGRILVDLIPYYYDTARMARITGEDNQARTVWLNKPYKTPQGDQKLHRIGVGTYEVAVTAAPGFATKQLETRELLTGMMRAMPRAFPFQAIGDLFFKSLGLYDIAKRMEKLLPPNLRDAPSGGSPPLPPEVKQQLDALLAQHEELVRQLNEAKRQIAMDQAKAESEERLTRLELDSKERIAGMTAQEKRDEALAKAELEIVKLEAMVTQKNAELLLESRLDEIKLLLEAQRTDLQRAEERAQTVADRDVAARASQSPAATLDSDASARPVGGGASPVESG